MAVKGFRSSKKLKKVIPNIDIMKTEDVEQYVTLNQLPSDRVGMDVIMHGLYAINAIPTTPQTGSDLRKIIFSSAHNLKAGDIIRFVTNQTECPVLGIVDSTTIILACELDFDPTTDTMTTWRYTTPSFDKNGALSVSGGALQYNEDGSTVTVTRDHAVLANNNALPVEVLDAAGNSVIAQVAADIASVKTNQTNSTQLTKITDGAGTVNTKQLGTSVTNSDIGLITNSVIHGQSTAGGGSFVDVKVTPSGALTTETTVTSSALPAGASTSALQTTGNTSLSSIDVKLTSLADGTQKTQIVDSSGNIVDTLTSGGKDNLLVAFGATNYYHSALNSTTTQLSSGATFTGTIETIFNQQSASVLVTTDQPGTLTINQYIDAAGTRLISSWPYSISANIPFSRAFTVNGNYFNLSFRNTGASATTTLNIDTAYGTIAATTNLGNGSVSVNEVNGDSVTSNLPTSSSQYLPVRSLPQKLFRTTFASAIASGVDTSFWSYVQAGSGIGVSQTGSNLVITSGVTANDEMIIRSREAFSGNTELKWSTILSQRIINQSFYVELVDLIGDSLAYSINSATSVTVTIPNNPFTAANIGQSLILQAINGTAGTIPGRYAISAIAGNSVTFTVASWPATGTGTLSLVGWNYVRATYSGATATNVIIETQRRGYNLNGSFTATINTTASPGHIGAISIEDAQVSLFDQLQAAAATLNLSRRADIVQSLPGETTPMYLQIHVLNGSTAPASTTTWTIGMASVATRRLQNVALNSITPMSQNAPLATSIVGTPTVTVGSITAGANVIGNVGVGVVSNADQASAAITTTTTSAAKTITNGSSVSITVNITVVSGTSPTYDFKVQESNDGTIWTDIWQAQRATAVSSIITPALRIRGTQYRYVETIGGTTPSFTRTITSARMPHAGELIRNIVDRTILPTTTNSVTPSLYVEGCSYYAITVFQGAGGSSVTFAIDGSMDGSSWVQNIKQIAGVVSGIVQGYATGGYKYIRARVVLGVASTTITYLQLQAKENGIDSSPYNLNASSSGTTSVSTVATVTPPAGAVGFILQCDGDAANPIRWRAGGAVATTTSGFLLQPGQDTGYMNGAPTLSIVSKSGTSSYNLEWILP